MKKKFIALLLTLCYMGMTQISWAITDFEQLDIQINQVPLVSRVGRSEAMPTF